LERRWEGALRELQKAEEALTRRRAGAHEPDALTIEERDNFLALGPELPAWWQQPDVSREQRRRCCDV
jgi:hypothetical protein